MRERLNESLDQGHHYLDRTIYCLLYTSSRINFSRTCKIATESCHQCCHLCREVGGDFGPVSYTHLAHERTDIEVTDDMKKHDDDIMDDDDF